MPNFEIKYKSHQLPHPYLNLSCKKNRAISYLNESPKYLFILPALLYKMLDNPAHK